MSNSRSSSPRQRSRRTLDPALLPLVDAAASLAELSREDWLGSRVRAAILAELADLDPELAEPHVLALMHWAAGNRQLDIQSLPSAETLAQALGVGASQARASGRRVESRAPERHALYDADALGASYKRISDEDQRKHFRALEASGATRALPLVTARHEREVTRLLTMAPHLRAATESVIGALAVARRAKEPLQQAPLLLSGPPATGKTWWAERIAVALGLPCVRIVLPKVTASFALSGGSTSWSQSRPGRIAQEFMGFDCATPILILDEVDKVNAGNYDPAPVLLDLLERASARHWHDEFFDIEFDVSRAIVIGTANRPQDMDPALRSRFREISVDRPGRSDLGAVIHSVWADHRARYPGLRLPKDLPGASVEQLAAGFSSIRELQRHFDDAIARAARRPGRLRLQPADLAGANPLRLVRQG